MAIRNPMEWGWDAVRHAVLVEPAAERVRPIPDERLVVNHIETADLRAALREGFKDFGAGRVDVVFLCIAYPIIGLLLARLVLGHAMLPLLFPLAAGFALVGPLAAVGLNEMSRQHERTGMMRWSDVFGVTRAASPGAIARLGLALFGIFLAWMVWAALIYVLTFGAVLPASADAFAHDIVRTAAGWSLIVLGCGVGFLFALGVLSICIVSFPLLLDHPVTARTAIRTSLRVVSTNPRTVAIWGLIVAAALVAGSIPFLLGLAVVLPVLGHATWHLYRRAVSVR